MRKRLYLIAIGILSIGAAGVAFSPPDKDSVVTPAQDGRYHLTTATVDFTSATGSGTAHLLFKLDSTTGRTWILDAGTTNRVSWREIFNAPQ